MKVNIDCPKCDADIAFYFIIERDGAVIPHLDRAIEKSCDCAISDAEMDALTDEATEKACEPEI